MERANMGGAFNPIVLVVEDEPLLRLCAVDIVADAGFETLAAANADAAMRILLSRNDIGVVFTDVQMPGSMDGLKLAHIAGEKWPPIKFIVTSGYAMIADQNLPRGWRFIEKPYEPWQIASALRELAA
jgi:two-component system, response regulator PdtaR